MLKNLLVAGAALGTFGIFIAPAQADERQSEAEYRYVRVSQVPSRETWAWVRVDRPERPYALTGEREKAPEPRSTLVWAGPHRVGVHMLRPDRE